MSTPALDKRPRICILFLCILCLPFAIGMSPSHQIELPSQKDTQHPLWESPSDPDDENRNTDLESPQNGPTGTKRPETLPAVLDALDALQEHYFQVWQGIWPTSIDWTSAVIGTYLSAALTTLSTSSPLLPTSSEQRDPSRENNNRINKYFSQLVASYFGQDAFALRNEAFDDMLWVVLGWLESIKFINIHSSLHYEIREGDQPWYGTQWIPAFAHRARIFWDLASQGWDTTLCNGGMIWSPYLAPYKNAITNELFIAASISMYLYFPGDSNSSPFFSSNDGGGYEPPGGPMGPQDPKYLSAAIEAYKWLNNSNMTDEKGLYVDGFHISGLPNRPYKNDTHGNTKCDARNNMVYTYNQGVLLTGQRGLYEATSARSYLEDGHKLIQDVIAATGYDLPHDRAYDDESPDKESTSRLPQWYGLGRSGILEDVCDAGGYCSQDGQTFKGIFFHHLTFFCSPLPPHLTKPGGTLNIRQFQLDKDWHDANCKAYKSWVLRNAKAALGTKDHVGKFGTWWGAPKMQKGLHFETEMPADAVDYINPKIPQENTWMDPSREGKKFNAFEGDFASRDLRAKDLNDRGRGRTVETQGGGLSVLRAAWEWGGSM